MADTLNINQIYQKSRWFYPGHKKTTFKIYYKYMALKRCILFTFKRQGMLDDYVPGKVENSNKLEVSDVGQFKAFKYLKYKYQEYQISKEESDRNERYSKRQEPKHNCLGFISQFEYFVIDRSSLVS